MEQVKEVIRKRLRDESEETESPEVKRLREDLLEGLGEESEICTSTQDLDSFMMSFQEEITAVEDAGSDFVSDTGESRPDLRYLLGASDDELGIPPPAESPVGLGAELSLIESDSSEFGGDYWGHTGYDSFGFGFGEAENYSGEYVALDGLFDYSDVGIGSGDFLWRPETLLAQ